LTDVERPITEPVPHERQGQHCWHIPATREHYGLVFDLRRVHSRLYTSGVSYLFFFGRYEFGPCFGYSSCQSVKGGTRLMISFGYPTIERLWLDRALEEGDAWGPKEGDGDRVIYGLPEWYETTRLNAQTGEREPWMPTVELAERVGYGSRYLDEEAGRDVVRFDLEQWEIWRNERSRLRGLERKYKTRSTR